MNKKVINISLILLLASTGSVFAQQGFGTNRPDKSAAVDIVSPNKGLLIPRVALQANNLAAPITSPETSLIVYNTTFNAANNLKQGFYFWEGTKWEPFTTATTDLNTTNVSLAVVAGELVLTDSDGHPVKVDVADLDKQQITTFALGTDHKVTLTLERGGTKEIDLSPYFNSTKLANGTNTTVSGTGTASDPYVVNVKSLTGDVTGDVLTNKVVKIQNVPVSATGPTIGQVLKEVSGTWTPSTLTGSDISDAKTISATSPVKVNNAASVAGATLKDVSITVDKASNTQLGVVQIGSNINVDTDGVISVDFPDGTVDTNTTTTVSSKTDQTYVTVDQSQTTGLPGDVINTRDYKIGVNKATSTTLGVVMPGTGMSIDTDGKLNVTPVADVLTSLTQDASGIHYKPETGAVQDAKVVSANTANIISVDATDFGAFLKAEDIRANQTTTTVKGTAPISVTPAAANVTGNTEYTISANVATTTTLGVVMPGTGMTVDTDGKLNVTSVPDVVTKIQNTVTGHKIADYTNEANAVVNINETITNLTQDASGITYVKEDGTSATAKVVSADTDNLVKTGTDFGAFLAKEDVQTSQIKYEVIDGENTTAQLDPTSTNDLKKYKVNVATGNGNTLGVVREAETNPTVNVTNGELAVNLTYTILEGEVTGPLNATVVANDVIDADNLKANAVTTAKILDANVTTAKIQPAAEPTTRMVMVTQTDGTVTWIPQTDIAPTTTNTLVLTSDDLVSTVNGVATTPAVDLSKYLDNTDKQEITNFSVTGGNLSITIENGNTMTVPLSSIDTDNQTITDLSLAGNVLSITLLRGGDPVTVDLTALTNTTNLDNGTNTTVSGDGSSTTPYEVNVATGNGTTLGVVRQADTAPSVTVTNGVLAVDPANVAITNALTSSGNQMSSTVNGGTAQTASIINTNALSLNGGNHLVSTINGIPSSALDLSAAVQAGETLTSITQDATSGVITYKRERDADQTANVVNSTTGNLISYNAGAFLNATTIQNNQLNTVVAQGTGITVTPSTSGNTTTYTVAANPVDAADLTNKGTLSVSGGLEFTGSSNGTDKLLANAGIGVANGGIDNVKLANNAVSAIKIEDGAVTASKVNANVAGTGLTKNTTTGALDVDMAAVETELADGTISSTTNGAITVTNGTNSTFKDVTLAVKAVSGVEIHDDNVKLGGNLTRETTITADATNTLAIAGLQPTTDAAKTTDAFVVVGDDGVLKKADIKYSTTEQVTGKKWINNATVYERVYSVTIAGNEVNSITLPGTAPSKILGMRMISTTDNSITTEISRYDNQTGEIVFGSGRTTQYQKTGTYDLILEYIK